MWIVRYVDLGPELLNKMNVKIYVIQIKICATYRDMLLRPKLLRQESGQMEFESIS